jgi:hypothetical protein
MKEERTSRFGYFRKLKRIDGVVFHKRKNCRFLGGFFLQF